MSSFGLLLQKIGRDVHQQYVLKCWDESCMLVATMCQTDPRFAQQSWLIEKFLLDAIVRPKDSALTELIDTMV